MDLSTKLEIVNLSHVGMKRIHNEDSTVSDPYNGLVVLADGMGGHESGEVASALVVTEIQHYVNKRLKNLKWKLKDTDPSGFHHESILIRDIIQNTNQKVHKISKTEKKCRGMGSTVVAGLFYDNKLCVAHVGDSRLYCYRDGTLTQMTTDHSLVQEFIERGLYTPEEAEVKVDKNVVTRAIGLEESVSVDIIEEQVLPNDIYLLCSDGLNDMVKDDEIVLTLKEYSANLTDSANKLVEIANKHGGKDNISIILVQVREEFPASKNFINKLKESFQ